MARRLRCYILANATLFLSFTFYLQIVGTLPQLSIAQAQSQTTQDRKAEAERLTKQGFQQLKREQFREAIETYQQALVILREIRHMQGEGATLNSIGEAYRRLSQYAKALDFYQQAFAIAKKIGDREGEETILENISLVHAQGIEHLSRGEFSEALEILQQVLVSVREIGNKAEEEAILNNIAVTYNRMEQYAKAQEFRTQALAIRRGIGEFKAEADRLILQGDRHLVAGEYVLATNTFEQALNIYRDIQDAPGRQMAINRLFVTYMYLEAWDKAGQLAEQTNLPSFYNNWQPILYPTIGGDLITQGMRRFQLEDYSEAIALFKRVIENSRGTQGTSDSRAAFAFTLLGDAYSKQGNYHQAITSYEQSLAISREIQNLSVEELALIQLVEAYFQQGDHRQALEYIDQGLKIVRKNPDNGILEQYLIALAKVYLSIGDYPKAITYSREVLTKVQEKNDSHSDENGLEPSDELEVESEVLGILGEALLKSGKFGEAEKVLTRAINTFESARNLGGFSSDMMTSNLNRVVEGQASISQSLQQSILPSKPLQQGQLALLLEIANLKQFGGLISDRPTINPLTIQQIKQIAQEQKATLVEYSVIYDNSYGKVRGKEEKLLIWVIKPTGEVAFEQVDLKSLNTSLKDLVPNTRQSMGVRGRSLEVSYEPGLEQSDRLKQLHKLLIEPIAQYLSTNPNDRVIFIPQNELFLVPFPALQDASGKYLIEKHTILTAPSIQVLQLTHEKRSTVSGDGVLVVGNPTMPSVTTTVGEASQQLTNLPGAQKEATDIAKLLKTQPLTGKQATKAAVLPKLSNARIIHLATHGLLDDFKGLGVPGAIALAPDGTGELNDGLLTSNEIFDLKLNAELVVLSACDTGRGRVTGDGVIGLSRSLITAGVPSVIVSLWSVPDAPTAELMTEFYQNLQKNRDKAQALRQAMLTTMETHPNPRDWAAFTLIGEAQ